MTRPKWAPHQILAPSRSKEDYYHGHQKDKKYNKWFKLIHLSQKAPYPSGTWFRSLRSSA